MSGTLPTPCAIGRALAVLQALPPAALAALAERLIGPWQGFLRDPHTSDANGP